MRNWLRLLLALSVLLAGLAVPVEGQTLGDAARREAERRGKLTGPAKVYTSGDLEGMSFYRGVAVDLVALKPANTAESVQAASPAPAATPPSASQGEQAALPKVRDKRPEEHWRERAKVINDRLNRLRSDAAAIEGRVAALRTELESAPAAQAAARAKEIEEADQDLTRLRVEIRLIQDEWTAFEERARQAKIPMSWIR